MFFKIRTAKANITPKIAVHLAEVFGTTPNLWLNLQQEYDIWVEENEKERTPIKPLLRFDHLINKRRSTSRRKIKKRNHNKKTGTA